MEKKNTEDLLDDFFDEIEKDSYQDTHHNSKSNYESNFKSTSTEDFEKKVKKTVENFSDATVNVAGILNDGIETFKKTFLENDKPIFEFEITEMNTRLDYVKKSLNNVKFDVFHRGQYKEGYGEALIYFVHQMEVSKYNLVDIEKEIKRAIRKKHYKEYKRSDRFNEGYADGLKFLKQTLYSSKVYMMNKVKEDLYNYQGYEI